jgi:hypothetical protein
MNCPAFASTAIAAALSLLTTHSHAMRPLATDDAGVLERGACELESSAPRSREPGLTRSEQAVGGGCGIGLRSQIGLEGSRSRSGDERGQAGAIAGKTFLFGNDGAVQWALGWSQGHERIEQRWQRSSREVALLATLPVRRGFVHVNVGHSRDLLGRTDTTAWGLAFEHEGFGWGGARLAPMAEVFGDDRERPWWNLGLQARLRDDSIGLGLSWGRQFGSGHSQVAVGVKLSF